MQVREIMIQPVVTAHPETSLEDVARLMLEERIGCVPVVDDFGKLLGIVTESDFSGRSCGFPFSTFRWPQVLQQWLPTEGLEEIYERARQTQVREIMTKEVQSVFEEDAIETVVRQMVDRELHRIPVLRGKVLVGMVTRHDLLKLMLPSVRSGAR